MIKKLCLFILSIGLVSACTTQSKSHEQLIGNWHSGISELPILSSQKRSENDYSYSEFVYSENYMFQYSNTPREPYFVKYLLKNDSLFFIIGRKKKEQFVGILNRPNDSTLWIYSSWDTVVHYKMKKTKTTLDQFIRSETEDLFPFEHLDTFDMYFQQRLNEKLKQHLKQKE